MEDILTVWETAQLLKIPADHVRFMIEMDRLPIVKTPSMLDVHIDGAALKRWIADGGKIVYPLDKNFYRIG